MNKNKKWLLERLVALGSEPVWGNDYFNSGMNAAFVSIGRLIDQLEEPEKLSSEWIRDHSDWAKMCHTGEKLKVVKTNKLEGLLLDEPEQVACAENERTTPTVSKKEIVVPQFVADWIEITKKSRWGILMLFDTNEMPSEEVDSWLTNTDSGPKNSELAARAWLDGYTIEQPKLLTVIVKDYDKTIMSKQMPEDEVNKMMEVIENEL